MDPRTHWWSDSDIKALAKEFKALHKDMSPKFRAHILETLGVEVTHVIVVPGHGEVYAFGADAARELAAQLLCPEALNS